MHTVMYECVCARVVHTPYPSECNASMFSLFHSSLSQSLPSLFMSVYLSRITVANASHFESILVVCSGSKSDYSLLLLLLLCHCYYMNVCCCCCCFCCFFPVRLVLIPILSFSVPIALRSKISFVRSHLLSAPSHIAGVAVAGCCQNTIHRANCWMNGCCCLFPIKMRVCVRMCRCRRHRRRYCCFDVVSMFPIDSALENWLESIHVVCGSIDRYFVIMVVAMVMVVVVATATTMLLMPLHLVIQIYPTRCDTDISKLNNTKRNWVKWMSERIHIVYD